MFSFFFFVSQKTISNSWLLVTHETIEVENLPCVGTPIEIIGDSARRKI